MWEENRSEMGRQVLTNVAELLQKRDMITQDELKKLKRTIMQKVGSGEWEQ